MPPEPGAIRGSDWWDNLDRFTPDFLSDRSQPNPTRPTERTSSHEISARQSVSA
ncbi:MAG: hypothetical protein MUC60_10050 [Oscillatoria sp. Prado101]|nr:hypothetical protein [Oscillatoria sp. Prado101]